MDDGKISVRYARALLSDAMEKHCETEVYEGLVRLTDNYSLAINAFNEVLSNPMIDNAEKLQLLHTAIGEPIHPCLERFLGFVTEKQREDKIFLIALKYQEMYRKEKNILRIVVTTATTIDDPVVGKIRDYVETTFHCSTETHVQVDPTIIGGFILDIENERMNSSVTGQLQRLKEELLSKP
ncbi:MAG: F0F1 ATP synthase subunit delta [Bacteroidales bacterium]|nr:F0F1 ATP synthase subunit delta [Bacteroidales bacterium]